MTPCSHKSIIHETTSRLDGTLTNHWYCLNCEIEFVPKKETPLQWTKDKPTFACIFMAREKIQHNEKERYEYWIGKFELTVKAFSTSGKPNR